MCSAVSNPPSSQQNGKELDHVVLPAAPCHGCSPCPGLSCGLMLKGGAEKIKLLSVLKHLQAHREGTGDASESSLPRGKATPLYLERRWLCSRQQGSTACKGRASRVTIALWWRGCAQGPKPVVVLLYHVTFLPVTDMSRAIFLWQQGGNLGKT